jgi:hypothetical protein
MADGQDYGPAAVAAGGDAGASPFEKAVFEIAIGALLFLIVCEAAEGVETPLADSLLEVFMLLAYSPRYAGHKFRPVLESAGVSFGPGVRRQAIENISSLV